MMRTQSVGLIPFVSARTSYSTTGRGVSFREAGNPVPRKSAHLSFKCYYGTALIAITGEVAGPYIELGQGDSADFPVATDAVFIKASGSEGCEVGFVAALNPIVEGIS